MKNWLLKALLAKIETGYGTDAVPTGVANAVLFRNLSITPMDGQDVSRELERPFFGGQPTIAAELRTKVTFDVEMAPSGVAGTAPAWGPLLRACGCAEVITAATSVTYNPVSSGFESVTLYFNVDGTRQILTGARGTATITLQAQGNPLINFEFTGLFSSPGESALPTVDLSAYMAPDLVTKANTPTFTVGAVGMALRQAKLTFGNAVEPRFLAGAATEEILITGRDDRFEATVEAVPMTTLNPFDMARTGATPAVTLVHGIVPGRRATITIPRAQVQRPTGLEQNQNVVEWPLSFVPLPDVGNDQWTLALT